MGAVALFPAGTRAAVPVQVELENVCVMLIFAVTGEGGGAVVASSLGAGAGIIGAGGGLVIVALTGAGAAWGGGEMIACSAG